VRLKSDDLGTFMYSESEHRPPHVIAEELSRENDLDEATELATELAHSIEDQKKKMAQSA
jgi:hypothetical protein